MKAVNLVPAEQRAGAGSSVGVYVLLGALALALVAVTGYVLISNKVADRQAELAQVTRRSATVDRQLAALRPYQDFAALERRRVSTVRSLAASRFDWDRTMGDLTRVTSGGVWLKSLVGTVTPDVSVESTASGSGSFRTALPNPALELAGCATTNKAVVGYLSRLRAMKKVVRVTLADAQKTDQPAPQGAGAGAPDTSGGGADEGCAGSDRWPAFRAIVFFAPTAGASAAPVAGSTTTATDATASTSSSSTASTTP